MGTLGFAFIHGGSHGSWAWSDIRQRLHLPSVAVDLPGRYGTSDEELRGIRLGDWVESATMQIRELDVERIFLVGHSLAGITMPGVARALRGRIEQMVFLSCFIPAEGKSVADSMLPVEREQLADGVLRVSPLVLRAQM